MSIIDRWERFRARFRGSDWDVPASSSRHVVEPVPSTLLTERATERSFEERFARQVIAPGFDQAALQDCLLIWVSARKRDPIGMHGLLLGAAMGFEQALIAPERADLDGVKRALLLNPDQPIDLVDGALLDDYLHSAIRRQRQVHVMIDVSLVQASLGGASRLLSLRQLSRRLYRSRTRSIALGAELHAVLSAADGAPDDVTSAHSQLAAALLVSDAVAAAGAYRRSSDGAAMPRSPAIDTIEKRCLGEISARGKTLLVVGAGGALGHAFLDALRADGELRAAFSRVVAVDPDSYEESNLNRQLLAGGPFNLGRSKSVVTTEALARAWPGSTLSVRRPAALPPRLRREPGAELIACTEPISRELIQELRPDVIGLFSDNFASRALSFEAARSLPGTFVLCGGTAFTAANLRSTQTGDAQGCCLDCGPEALRRLAADEGTGRPSCSAEATPSNVLTNALAGSLAALQLRRWLSSGSIECRQTLVDWSLPQRIWNAPTLPACGCWHGPNTGVARSRVCQA